MRSPSRFALVIVAVMLAAAPPALAGFAGTDLFLPMVGRQAGVYPSNWYTTIWVHNPGTEAANARIHFLERGTANPSPPAVDVLVGPGDTEKIENIVESLFQRQAYGALRVTCATQKLVVTSRVYSKAAGEDDTDSMGQDFAGVPASFAIGAGGRTQILGTHQTVPTAGSEFRFNFGFVETTGHSVNVRVTAYDDNGTFQDAKDFNVREWSQRQVAFMDHFPAVSTENTRLEVEVISGSGKVIAYGSAVANGSQDPTTFDMIYKDSLLGIATVQHDPTLVGDGTAAAPLGLADGAVTLAKLGTANTPSLAPGGAVSAFPAAQSQVLTTDGSTLSWQVQAALTLPWSGQTPQPTSDAAFAVTNVGGGLFGISGAGANGVYGNGSARGVWGSGNVEGVFGESPTGTGVFGFSNSNTGVQGYSPSGNGVAGDSLSGTGVAGASGSAYGVHGRSTTGDGVFGEASAADKSGVYGVNPNPAGWAGFFGGRVGLTGDLECMGCVSNGDLAGGAVTMGKLAAAGGAAGQVLGTGNGTTLAWRNDWLTLPFSATSANGMPFVVRSTDPSASIAILGVASTDPVAMSWFPGRTGVSGYSQMGRAVGGIADGPFPAIEGSNGGTGAGVEGRAPVGPGVRAHSTSGPGVLATSSSADAFSADGSGRHGLLVQGANDDGVHVGDAGHDGIEVTSAGWSGVYVSSAGFDALRVQSAGQDGLRLFANIGRDFIRAGDDSDLKFRVTNAGAAYADGGWQGAADFAELVAGDTEGGRLEPGDVLVIGERSDRTVQRSTSPYSTLVAGIYSTKPGFVGSPHPVSEPRPGELPVALVGIVPCKVSAENGAIRRGDLLVTSATPGHAMRAGSPPPGTVVGKALQPLNAGAGVIEVLVSLQ